MAAGHSSGLPVVVSWTVGGFTLGTCLAGIAFVLSFPALYFVGAWLRYPNRERFVRPLAIWLGLTVVFGRCCRDHPSAAPIALGPAVCRARYRKPDRHQAEA